jgi:hypothetical protein
VLNSLNISSNGDPGGNSKGKGLMLVTIVCVVEIFTTDGINFPAKSAKDSGTFLACAKNAKLIIKNTTNNILVFFILIFNIPNN